VNETLLLSLPGQVRFQPCQVRDLTVFGAGLWLDKFTLLPIEFELSFDRFRTSFRCGLIWKDRGGVEFKISDEIA
jgi:hypothetical protein